MAKKKNESKLFATGHRATRCSYCGRWITFLLNKNDKPVPVHEEGLESAWYNDEGNLVGDTRIVEGRHVIHFIHCDNQDLRTAERRGQDYCMVVGCQNKMAKELIVCGNHFGMCGNADESDPEKRRKDKYSIERLRKMRGPFGNPYKGDSKDLDIGADGIDPNDEDALFAAVVRLEVLKTNHVRMATHNKRKARDRERRQQQK